MGCVSSKKATSFRELPSFTPKSCLNCKQPYAHRRWCKPCVIKRFKSDFANWTSGNLELDNYIRYTQLNITNSSSFLEWIPYDKFDDVREMYKGGFGIVCSAIWDLGPKLFWDDGAENWVREGEKPIALKRLQNSRNADPEFWKECWDADSKLRPNIREIEKILMSWGWHMGVSQKHIVSNQFFVAEKVRLQLLKSDDSNLKPFTTPHPQAIYKSHLLDFENLPTPRNLNDLKEALDLITVVVPPALPTTMSIGTSFAIQRLKKSGIFCISPPRVNMGGKLNVMCFDKTGTLTEDGLDVLGIRYVDYSSNRFSELYTNIETLCPKNDNDSLVNMKNVFPNSKIEPILFAMTTCHSLKLVNNELIGDPLDLKMFQFTKWILEESGQGSSTANSLGITNGSSPNSPITGGIVPTVVRPPGGRQFDLTDILGNEERNGESKANQLFELGIIRTFEFVSSLRRMSVLVKRLRSNTIEVYVKGAPEVMREICVPDSFPTDYNELLNYYTHHGFRVIACAYKSFTDLSWMKAQKIKREQVEQGLQFLGLIIFENKLKPGTAPVINTLKKANMRQIMCTGDNVLTAISVSRECGLINPDGKIYVPRFSQGTSSDPQTTIIWESLKDVNDLLDSDTLKPCLSNNNLNAPPIGLYDYTLAVTGDVFRWIVDNCDELILYRMLVKGHVFARMSPDEKHELVEKLQEMGYSVGFCGDGANDIGALKGADVGISLSEAEASVAAPFTSRKMEIDCVIEVIKEGRAALVTSFSCFKFMTLYSIIQFTTVMGQTGPYHNIHPKRPTANLVSKSVLTPLLGQIFIQSGFQFFVFLLVRRQPW
ncbi:11439_t:CDS:10 [Entrophospora sp. SA101]|nr:11439_t:CDS:10 [Entrophospora sp. SA101]